MASEDPGFTPLDPAVIPPDPRHLGRPAPAGAGGTTTTGSRPTWCSTNGWQPDHEFCPSARPHDPSHFRPSIPPAAEARERGFPPLDGRAAGARSADPAVSSRQRPPVAAGEQSASAAAMARARIRQIADGAEPPKRPILSRSGMCPYDHGSRTQRARRHCQRLPSPPRGKAPCLRLRRRARLPTWRERHP